jgi:hypothetical protein
MLPNNVLPKERTKRSRCVQVCVKKRRKLVASNAKMENHSSPNEGGG